jgi:uracil-DNA glycosylase
MIPEPTNPWRELRAYVRWLGTTGQQFDFAELEARAQDVRASALAGNAVALEASSGRHPMDDVRDAIGRCMKCGLGATRTNAVCGVGSVNADLMFIGEAPGAVEDEKGLPFVGPAGRVLTEELNKNGITRDEVYITNIIKCRPPGNRDPQPDEIAACEPFLLKQIDVIKPGMLCVLGRHAAATLLKRPIGIMKLRGTWDSYHGVPLFICLHPSATLHSPANRPLFNGDIATLAQRYAQFRTAKGLSCGGARISSECRPESRAGAAICPLMRKTAFLRTQRVQFQYIAHAPQSTRVA